MLTRNIIFGDVLANTDIMRGCTGFYTHVAPQVCGASAISRIPDLLGGGLRSPSAFLVLYTLPLNPMTIILQVPQTDESTEEYPLQIRN